jgi:hypothetical protein
MKVLWSKKSEEVYQKYIDQTVDKFSEELAIEFIDDVESLINKIKSDKELCPQSKIKSLRKCVVNVNISLVYKASPQKIEIVTFVFNRSAHKY